MSKVSFEDQVLNECKNKQNIFIFVSKEDEVDTKSIIKRLLELGKTVVVPICCLSENKLLLSEIESIDDLTPSSYKILEPKNIINFPKENINIFFVPGTKFDKKGNRKGRGKGYFDGFLADVKGKKPIVGLCYRNQVTNRLEVKEHDISVDRTIIKNYLKD